MQRKLISFDWAIKRILRSKANFEILEGFLSELLFEDITILEILESESNKDSYDEATFESSVTKRVKETIDLSSKTHLFYHPYSNKKESSFYLEFTKSGSRDVEGVVDQKEESTSGSRIDE